MAAENLCIAKTELECVQSSKAFLQSYVLFGFLIRYVVFGY